MKTIRVSRNLLVHCVSPFAQHRTAPNPVIRALAFEEFNIMMRCTLTHMESAWGNTHVRFLNWCTRIELACRDAKEKLTEEEYAEFSSLLLNREGLCRKRFRGA